MKKFFKIAALAVVFLAGIAAVVHSTVASQNTVSYKATVDEYHAVDVLDIKTAFLIWDEVPWEKGNTFGLYDQKEEQIVQICIYKGTGLKKCYKKNSAGLWNPYAEAQKLAAIEKRLTDALVATVKPENIVK